MLIDPVEFEGQLRPLAAGSAFFIDRSTVVTAHHTLAGLLATNARGEQRAVLLAPGGTAVVNIRRQARALPEHDLAILTDVNPIDAPYDWNDTMPTVGSAIEIVGFPSAHLDLARDSYEDRYRRFLLGRSKRAGRVTHVIRADGPFETGGVVLRHAPVMKHSAPTETGFSGGPVLHAGRVVGVSIGQQPGVNPGLAVGLEGIHTLHGRGP